MIKLGINRRSMQNKYFIEYLLTVDIDDKKYDLGISFLIWSHIRPNEPTTFSLRPEATPRILSGPRSPVKKRKAPRGYFKKGHEYYWKTGIDNIKGRINMTSFPLNLKDNAELFIYCFNDPIIFSPVYQERLKELQIYSDKNTQEVWSAPKWNEIDKKSLIPVKEVPKKADNFFKYVFCLSLKKAGYEIQDW